MDTLTTIKLLRMCYSLFKTRNLISLAVASDLYDLVMEQTHSEDIKMQTKQAEAAGYNKIKTLSYLEHRLNLGITR